MKDPIGTKVDRIVVAVRIAIIESESDSLRWDNTKFFEVFK